MYRARSLLAAAVCLDGKRATTHWSYIDQLADRYGNLTIERDPIFVKDGKTYTTAGISAGIDLALALVEEDFGHDVAAACASSHGSVFEKAWHLQRAVQHLARTTGRCQRARRCVIFRRGPKRGSPRHLDVNTLAKVVAMTPRTFARQFEIHFRTTPARWVQSRFVSKRARQHLRQSCL